MANQLCVEKSKRTKTRKLPFLPRFGFVIEVGGRQISYRQVPMTETLLNLRERGFSMKNFVRVALEQLGEIELPKVKIQAL
jgi:hypothetical protein